MRATGIMEPVAAGTAMGGHGGTRWWHRVTLGLGAGLGATLLVALTIGLASARPVGAEDNGDGYRLFCGVGLLPRSIDRFAFWKGGYIGDFSVGPPTCGMSMPSSASLVLRGAALGDGSLSLVTVAWWYAVLVGVAVGVAAWAASASGRLRAAVLVVPVAPLALASFSRFFLSTYSEPAGLLGLVTAGCGLAAYLVLRGDVRAARRTALVLLVLGGGLAATAKVAYLPVALVVAVVVAVLVRREVVHGRLRWPRVVGPVVALACLLAVAAPIVGGIHFQDTIYEGANVHDVVFTMAVPELGPGAPAEIGLPPDAAAVAGNGYFNGPPHPQDGWWVRDITERPKALRDDAFVALASHPSALLRVIGVGVQATERADLPYLAATPADPALPSAPGGDIGWSGARGPDLHAVLDQPGHPAWLPSTVLALAVLAAASTVAWRRRAPAAARWCRAAGAGAALSLGLVVMALAGDGYFEVFKHVWLAAYALLVTGFCLVGALGAGIVHLVRRRVARAGVATTAPAEVVEPVPAVPSLVGALVGALVGSMAAVCAGARSKS